jgi:primosomal protein N' (replication factor Y)
VFFIVLLAPSRRRQKNLAAQARYTGAGMPFAEVCVNAAAPIRQTFTYSIPDHLTVLPGHVVYVPFGSRTLQGVVMEITDTPSYAEARDIAGVVDPRPLVTPERIVLARLIGDHYLAPLFDCVALMLPPGSRERPLTLLEPLATIDELPELGLTEKQQIALTYIIEHGAINPADLSRDAHLTGVPNIVSALLRRGFIRRRYELARPAARPRVVPHLRLLASESEAIDKARTLRGEGTQKALKRALVLEALADEHVIPLARARFLGLTPAYLRDLESARVAVGVQVTMTRDPLEGRIFSYKPPAHLTPDQQAATGAIIAAIDVPHPGHRHQTFLLHGVTGSGKTEVYLAALDRAVTLGKRAIVLVPEISLTPQTVRRFGERLPGRVAVMHSALSPGEHFDMWHRIREGHYDVVVGPRGALFAPQPDLALVVIDEEHEWTYKQHEGSPRYHARFAAEHLCRETGAVLVLGSATPDVESYFHTQDGSYRLLDLPDRLVRSSTGDVAAAPLPAVEVVDLREELKTGNRSIFSRALAGGIRQALDSREQVILFLNRRGSSTFIQCRDCGHVLSCRSCEMPYTYHEREDRLVCHYCGRRAGRPASCPSCKGSRIRMLGIGTERVEAEVQSAFPAARTLRWDRDVTKGRDSHEAILARFLAHEADVLIGTQMVAKGLDIPLVTLVGVISADVALHIPDFRAGERTFQLLEQVAGRAGRGPLGGRVVVQTYTPEHHSIQAAAAHDYGRMYDREIDIRRKLGYPPFGRLVRMTFSHTGAAYAQEQAALMVSRLRKEQDRLGLANIDVIGPAPAHLPRLRGRWRWNVALRGANPASLLTEMTLPRGWSVDVDPASLL